MNLKRNQKRVLLLLVGLVIVAVITLDLLRSAQGIAGTSKRNNIESNKTNYNEQPGKSETGTGRAQSAWHHLHLRIQF